MRFKWRKWNRAIHRDLGYFFFALTIIYSLSGIAINHLNDWNPNYIISITEVKVSIPSNLDLIDKDFVIDMLNQFDEGDNYKKHFITRHNEIKVFLKGGNVIIDTESGSGTIEKIKRRPILHAVNFLHYNPGKWWAIFSDIFAGSLIIVAISGLFILKGKNGITRRGAILTIIGLTFPIFYLIFFY